MTPLTLTIAAVLAAAAAAAIGHRYSPARQHRRQQQAVAQHRRLARLRMDGHLAIHDNEALFLRLLAEHDEMHDLAAATIRPMEA